MFFLKQIKKTGVALDIGEHDLNLNAIGSPIFNVEGIPVAAVVVIGLANRIDNRLSGNTVKEIKETADKISKRLYYIEQAPDSLWEWLESIKET